jgi:hypothetical protein
MDLVDRDLLGEEEQLEDRKIDFTKGGKKRLMTN